MPTKLPSNSTRATCDGAKVDAGTFAGALDFTRLKKSSTNAGKNPPPCLCHRVCASASNATK